MKETPSLERLFKPSSIAIIGASNDDQRGGGFLLKGLIRNKFKGILYPVNPGEAESMGLRGYPTVLDIPGEVDLAIIAVPANVVPQVMAQCGEKGVRFAVIHSVGFAELGAQGKLRQDEVIVIARRSGTRVIGPNCMGIYCPEVGLNTVAAAARVSQDGGAVAVLSQSGWVGENFIEIGYERGLRFSQAVSVGNQSDLSVEDFLKHFGDDSQTKVIACYIEGIKRGREFHQLLREVSRRKPVIVWKAGRTEAGARAAASHTGSLASNSAVFDAVLKQSGAVMAYNLEEMIDLAIGFNCPVLPAGNRLGVVTLAGGSGVATADSYQALGLEMPTLSEELQKTIASTLRNSTVAFPNLRNPVDIVWPRNWPTGSAVLQCSELVLKEVDMVLVIDHAILTRRLATHITALRDASGKPIIMVPQRIHGQTKGRSLLVRNGIPTFTTPDRAIRVFAAMARYASYRNQSR